MKAVKIIIGVLAVLFVVAHLVELPGFLKKLTDVPDALRVSAWAGKIIALLLGTAVAVVCFRKKTS